MRTTLELDENLLEATVKATGEKNKGKAVNKALQEYLQWQAIQDLRAMAGHVDLADDLEDVLRRQDRLSIERLNRAQR